MIMILLASTIAPLPAPRHEPSRVIARIVRGERISADRWLQSSQKRERVIVDEQGAKLLLRLVEFE